MASFLSDEQIAMRTGAFIRHFETFSAFSSVIVHKEPLKVLAAVNADVLPGYGEQSNEGNFTLVPVSGVYRAMIINERNTAEQIIHELQTHAPANRIKIKVELDAYQFISNGKNELFEVNGLTYNSIENTYVQNYLGAKYYVIELKAAI